MIVEKIVPVRRNKIGKIIQECFFGFFYTLTSKFSKNPYNKTLIKKFFEFRSQENSFQDFTESTSDWYISSISTDFVTNLINRPNVTILDIGCGRGGLLTFLKKINNDCDYTGIDFDEIAIKKAIEAFKNYKKVSFNFVDITSSQIKNTGVFEIIFMINILPYIDNVALLIHDIKSLLKPDGSVVIIDPYPSLYWQDSFGGFQILIRKPKEIKSLFEKHGFKLTYSAQLVSAKFRNIKLLPINTLFVFKLI